MSKLQYLEKYLAKPGEESVGSDRIKKREKKGNKRTVAEPRRFQICDLSEILPVPREERNKIEPQRIPDEDGTVFVDEHLVADAQKVEVETSGVKWHIQQHLRSRAHIRRVKEEEASEGGSDLSPPRTRGARPEQARRPSRGEQTAAECCPAADSDASPPRAGPRGGRERERERDLSDLSPPRAPGRGADSDPSPPRVGPRRGADGARPEAKREPGSEEEDLSPPRRAPSGPRAPRPAGAGPSAAAPGAARAARQRHDSDAEDLSPPRPSAQRPRAAAAAAAEGGGERMSSGFRAGLVQAAQLRDEATRLREERRARVEAAPAEETGKGAGTVYRDKGGKRISREEWVEQRQAKKRKRLSEYPEQELEWGGGVKQRVCREEEMAEVERIAAQPFARFEPDAKYMEELRERQDWNDPMRQARPGTEDGAQVCKEASTAKRPKCPHPPWPNRFNIGPGYRWDGKVRGNGYEKNWLEARNQREFQKQEQWKYEMEEL